ncbi:hypothetical protein DFH94DRAFT_639426 [Russula ochroleuca]|uniref:Yeast cell wall synthesis Kre9/Knh1-like N-terminal domain-containing protein n=1 Tax=Russula ochroleuca TaxID=152965 RepID=A0A9P5JWR4_9AGAM|nr:hypothetical protein DFH94DRAFT_639426 [Russula ochroleuca]
MPALCEASASPNILLTAAITITGPSASSYWVQNTSNLISWTYTTGGPASVDIVVNNSNNQTLNGNFSIARSVPVSQESFTVTDVTLRVGTGYKVLFVDTNTDSQVIAQSSDFEVKAPGTSPAPTATPSTSLQGSGTPSTGSSTASGSSASSTSTKKNNAATGLAVDARGLFYACGTLAFGSFFL